MEPRSQAPGGRGTAPTELDRVPLAELRARQARAQARLRDLLGPLSIPELQILSTNGAWTAMAAEIDAYFDLVGAVYRRDPARALARWAYGWPQELGADRAEEHAAELGLARYLGQIARVTGVLRGPVRSAIEPFRGDDGRYDLTIADIGCGADPLKGWLLEQGPRFDGTVWGVELRPDTVGAGRQRVEELVRRGVVRRDQVHILQGDITRPHTLPAEVLAADLWVSSLVFHELTASEQVLGLLLSRGRRSFRHTTYADTPFSVGLAAIYPGTALVCRLKGVAPDVRGHLLRLVRRIMRNAIPLAALGELAALAGAQVRRDGGVFLRYEPRR